MRNVKYLSNQELTEELYESKNPTWSIEEQDRKKLLRDELIDRLNEPWKRLKECITVEKHKEKMTDLLDKFSNELNSINYKHKIKHQIKEIKKRIKNEQKRLG